MTEQLGSQHVNWSPFDEHRKRKNPDYVPKPKPANYKGRVILTTVGRCIFNDILPKEMPFYNYALTLYRAGKHEEAIAAFAALRQTMSAQVGVVRDAAGLRSALASLLPRFYDPTSGRVLLDGHDIRDLRMASLRAMKVESDSGPTRVRMLDSPTSKESWTLPT